MRKNRVLLKEEAISDLEVAESNSRCSKLDLISDLVD